MRPVDGDALLGTEKLLDTETIQKSKEANFILGQVLFDIANAPTVDAAPVRCGECRGWEPEKRKIHKCDLCRMLGFGPGDYCSLGHRKDGEMKKRFSKKQIEKKYNVILERASAGLDFDYPAWLAYSNDGEHEQLAFEDTLSDIANALDEIQEGEANHE